MAGSSQHPSQFKSTAFIFVVSRRPILGIRTINENTNPDSLLTAVLTQIALLIVFRNPAGIQERVTKLNMKTKTKKSPTKLRVISTANPKEKMVRIAGLEPAHLAALPPQSSVSANSTICATGE